MAVLVRDFGDVQLAEDCAQEAFVAASQRWGNDVPVPDNPAAWLTTTARRKGLDRVRRTATYKEKLHELEVRAKRGPQPNDHGELIDEQLALLLGCCHPALNLEAQVALTLRLVAGLTTEQIARAFLVEEATMGKRITRAKGKIRDAGIPFGAVGRDELSERIGAVRHVIYLIFTEGHSAHGDEEFVRGDLCEEALWLASLLAELLPDEPEAHGLLALILLTDARRSTRADADGVPILLEDQDRYSWDRDKISAGLAALKRADGLGPLGGFGLQALIAFHHVSAPTFDETNWGQIVTAYDLLARLDDGPVVKLNRAVAISFAESPEEGLEAIEPLREPLDGYLYLHSTRAELLRRTGATAEARESYVTALGCSPNSAERAFLEQRLAELA